MFDVVIVGGGPCGATAAKDLARSGHKVALLDREGRIKPCGGAIPPRLMEDFDIPEAQLLTKVNTARMISPTGRSIDIPIKNGFVGMVDRKDFDPFLRQRAQQAGAEYVVGTFLRIDREDGTTKVIYREKPSGETKELPTKLIIGADGAKSRVGNAEVPDADKVPSVYAYHEIIEAPEHSAIYDPERCDVIYNGAISPDFYSWIFPHGNTISVGMGTENPDVDLKHATAALRKASGLEGCKTIREEGGLIPLKPMDRWDNGKDVVLAGDAAGVVASSSGEGIYYAMTCGRVAATACAATLASENAKDLKLARKLFMQEHKTVFRKLASMQNAYYKSDMRRERFVSLCHDIDVQRLTFEAYLNKRLVKASPMAHLKVGMKNLAHLTGLVRPTHT